MNNNLKDSQKKQNKQSSSNKHYDLDQKQFLQQQPEKIELLLDQQILERESNISILSSSVDNIDSQYLRKYENYMNTSNQQKFNHQSIKVLRRQLKNILTAQGFTLLKLKEVPYNQMKVLNINRGYSYQVIELQFQVGSFSKVLKIYNSPHNSPFHTQNILASGSFGNTYKWEQFQNQRVIKCISFKEYLKNMIEVDFRKFQLVLKQILKEYIFCQICSILKIGPKLLKPFGFDIILTEDCAQFCMEKCENIQGLTRNIDQYINQLKQNLFKLHVLNIVHNDIKPDNIMYSPTYKKIILIDFGLTQCLKQKIGQKTYTKFVGTFQFCCTQMQKILLSNRRQQIDLYYNDAYSLNRSLDKFQKPYNQQKNLQVSFSQSINYENYQTNKQTKERRKDFDEKLNIILLKYCLFSQQIDLAKKFAEKLNLKNNQILQLEIMQFLYTLNFSNSLKTFYYEALSKNVRQNKKYLFLKEKILKTNFFSAQSNKYIPASSQYYRNLYEDLQKDYLYGQIKQERLKFQQIQQKLLNFNYKQKNKNQKLSKRQVFQNNFIQQEEAHYSYLISYLNFFKRSWQISFQHKLKAAQQFLVKLSSQSQYDFSATLQQNNQFNGIMFEPILNVYAHLISYCLTKPMNSWKKQNFIEVIVQSIILGRKFTLSHLNQWLYEFVNSISCFNQKIFFILKFQYLKAVDKARQFKTIYQKNNLKAKFSSFSKKNKQKEKRANQRQSLSQIDNLKLQRYNQSNCYKDLYSHLEQTLQNMKQEKSKEKKQHNEDAIQEQVYSQDNLQQSIKLFNILKLVIFDNESSAKQFEAIIEKLEKSVQIKRSSQSLQILVCVIKQCIEKYKTQKSNQDNQIKLLNEISRLSNICFERDSTKQVYEISFYHFQMILQYSNRKDYKKLKILLQYFDKTINFKSISQDFCVAQRLLLYYTYNEVQSFSLIIKKILSLPIDPFQKIKKGAKFQQISLKRDYKQDYSLRIFKCLGIFYYNMHYSKFINQNSQLYFSMFGYKIQEKIHQFLIFVSKHQQIFFEQQSSLKAINRFYEYSDYNLNSYFQLLCCVITLANVLETTSIIKKNAHHYLNFLQVIYQKSKHKISITKHINLKQLFLRTKLTYFAKQKRYQQVKRIYEAQCGNLEITQIKSIAEMQNFWQYHVSKSLSGNPNLEISVKVCEYFKKCNSIHKIFLNVSLQDTMLFYLCQYQDYQYMFDFFQTISKYVSEHVSLSNIKILHNRVQSVCGYFSSQGTIENLIEFIRICIKNIQKIKTWDNPYICIFVLNLIHACLSMKQSKLQFKSNLNQLKQQQQLQEQKQQIYVKDLKQEYKEYIDLALQHATHCLEFIASGKPLVLQTYYSIAKVINNQNMRKRLYYFKKYFKWSSQKQNLYNYILKKCIFYGQNQILYPVIKKIALPPENIFSKIKRKIEMYHDNIQNLSRINYVNILNETKN